MTEEEAIIEVDNIKKALTAWLVSQEANSTLAMQALLEVAGSLIGSYANSQSKLISAIDAARSLIVGFSVSAYKNKQKQENNHGSN